MSSSRLIEALRARLRLVALSVLVSLSAGVLSFFLTPRVYEVSMLMEVQSDTIGPFSTYLAWTVRQALESGVLNPKIAEKAGISALDMPRLRAKVMYNTQLVKLYVFVPEARVKTAGSALLASVEAARDVFPAHQNAHRKDVKAAVEEIRDLLERKRAIDAGMSDLSRGRTELKESMALAAWMSDLSSFLKKYAAVLEEGQTPYAFALRTLSEPETSEVPVDPPLFHRLLAFGLLGVSAGCALALIAEERGSAE